MAASRVELVRIDVLNGVNLDLLGRRDPGLYGESSLSGPRDSDLRMGARARPPGALPADESRGRVRRVAPCRARQSPTAWCSTPPRGRTTRGRSATRWRRSPDPIVEVHISNVDEREEWRQHSVLEGLAASPHRRQGDRRVPRGARPARRGRRVSRLERLAARLERPLLVTKGVNIRYLTGLESSNAAALVEPTGATTLYTDFRYAPAAREVVGVTFVETSRYVIQALAELLAGREIGIEADHLSYASFEALRSGGVELEPTTRRRGGASRRQGRRRDRGAAPCRRALRRGLRRALPRAVRGADGGGARVVDRPPLSRARCDSQLLRHHGRVRRDGRPPARARRATTSPSRRGRRSWSTPAASSTGTAPTARARS